MNKKKHYYSNSDRTGGHIFPVISPAQYLSGQKKFEVEITTDIRGKSFIVDKSLKRRLFQL